MKRDGSIVRIGIDLGGSNIAAGLLADGGLAYKCKVKTDTSSESAVLHGLADVVFDVMKACGLDAGCARYGSCQCSGWRHRNCC